MPTYVKRMNSKWIVKNDLGKKLYMEKHFLKMGGKCTIFLINSSWFCFAVEELGSKKFIVS
jgi:hypothetical protein